MSFILNTFAYSWKINISLPLILFLIFSYFIRIEILNNQIIQSNVLAFVSQDASIVNTRMLAINVDGL